MSLSEQIPGIYLQWYVFLDWKNIKTISSIQSSCQVIVRQGIV